MQPKRKSPPRTGSTTSSASSKRSRGSEEQESPRRGTPSPRREMQAGPSTHGEKRGRSCSSDSTASSKRHCRSMTSSASNAVDSRVDGGVSETRSSLEDEATSNRLSSSPPTAPARPTGFQAASVGSGPRIPPLVDTLVPEAASGGSGTPTPPLVDASVPQEASDANRTSRSVHVENFRPPEVSGESGAPIFSLVDSQGRSFPNIRRVGGRREVTLPPSVEGLVRAHEDQGHVVHSFRMLVSQRRRMAWVQLITERGLLNPAMPVPSFDDIIELLREYSGPSTRADINAMLAEPHVGDSSVAGPSTRADINAMFAGADVSDNTDVYIREVLRSLSGPSTFAQHSASVAGPVSVEETVSGVLEDITNTIGVDPEESDESTMDMEDGEQVGEQVGVVHVGRYALRNTAARRGRASGAFNYHG